MSKATTCQKALKNWEEAHPDQNPAEAEEIKLLFQVPPIEKLEANVLNTLTNVRKLSLSSNAIEKMVNLPNLRNIEILSLSRNQIKKIACLEEIGATLRELWLSYNNIEKLDGLQPCTKLQVLYIGNNKIKNWDEIDKLKELPEIANVVFTGNPIYANQQPDESRGNVLKRVPTLKNVDGLLITEQLLKKYLA